VLGLVIACVVVAGLVDDIARLLRPMQQLVVAVYDNQHLPTQSQASSANQRLRRQVFEAYSGNSGSGLESWCVFTGLWWPLLARAGCPYVHAAHIMGRATPAVDWVRYMYQFEYACRGPSLAPLLVYHLVLQQPQRPSVSRTWHLAFLITAVCQSVN
jgi:hypothetical protein